MAIAVTSALHESEHPAPSGHPEDAKRLQLVAELFSVPGKYHLPVSIPPVRNLDTTISAVHQPAYVRQLQRFSEVGGGYFDTDTYVALKSYQAACTMARLACGAVEMAHSGKHNKIFVLGRPPGHHAESGRGMGFCLLNSIAVAAQYAREHQYASRIAIVDFDVHHGNGTQDIFYDRDDVLFLSTHQFPLYPGTGSTAEKGTGPGEGFTFNVPLRAGTDHPAMAKVITEYIRPALESYRPDLILVSAGFDAHVDDPLGGLVWTGDTFRLWGELLADISRRYSVGRLVAITEGGYNPRANLTSVQSFLEGLST